MHHASNATVLLDILKPHKNQSIPWIWLGSNRKGTCCNNLQTFFRGPDLTESKSEE